MVVDVVMTLADCCALEMGAGTRDLGLLIHDSLHGKKTLTRMLGGV